MIIADRPFTVALRTFFITILFYYLLISLFYIFYLAISCLVDLIYIYLILLFYYIIFFISIYLYIALYEHLYWTTLHFVQDEDPCNDDDDDDDDDDDNHFNVYHYIFDYHNTSYCIATKIYSYGCVRTCLASF